MKSKFAVIIFATSILLSACSTDFDVTGDWKETMVVYGLLDQAQPKQFIKINKAFLGQGNAMEYSQIKDSVQFVNTLSVTLKRIKNGSELATYTLLPDNTIPKDPGTFYGPDQTNAIYSFASTGASALDEDSQYKLIIKNTETGKEVTSQTALVKDCIIKNPSSSATKFSFVLAGQDNYRFTYKVQTGANARIYQTIVRLHYTDSTTAGVVNQTLDWVASQQYTTGLSGGEELDFSFVGQDYMRFIGNTLTDYPGLYSRTAGNVDLMVISAADELNTFIDVNRPSTGIIQEKPEYTNITNGLGIFSARYYKPPFSRPLTTTTIDSIAGGHFTRCLKFKNAAGVWPGC